MLTLAPGCQPWRLRPALAALRLPSRTVAAGRICGTSSRRSVADLETARFNVATAPKDRSVYYRGRSRRSSTWWCADRRLKSVSTACAGTAHVPFCAAGAEIACFVRRHLALSGLMLAGQARLATGSMEACHGAINDGEGLGHQWRVTQLKRLRIPGRWRKPRPIASTGIRSSGWFGAAFCAGGVVAGRRCCRSARTRWGRSWCVAAVSTSASGTWAMSAGVVR
jgi:hypothetical protein